MVDGVHGHVEPVIRHMVIEQSNVVDNVIVLYLPVEEKIILAQIMRKDHVQTFAVLVRTINMSFQSQNVMLASKTRRCVIFSHC